eukprot:TRINITY_DN1175_c0_g1_i4.p2 TRINITY_DN1175_c0_g1~~TRINITY_DN1175_c0_g1_i4.p2  ORF type:complete len:118 (-),score=2.34 TRINITY_DN1175_c0_g1_i4:17-370(-)
MLFFFPSAPPRWGQYVLPFSSFPHRGLFCVGDLSIGGPPVLALTFSELQAAAFGCARRCSDCPSARSGMILCLQRFFFFGGQEPTPRCGTAPSASVNASTVTHTAQCVRLAYLSGTH